MKKKYNRANPPFWGEVHVENWDKEVDDESFPDCSLGHKIYNSDYYEEDMCGACMTGEAGELFKHRKNCDCRKCQQ